jgi:hypothetical protein
MIFQMLSASLQGLTHQEALHRRPRRAVNHLRHGSGFRIGKKTMARKGLTAKVPTP